MGFDCAQYLALGRCTWRPCRSRQRAVRAAASDGMAAYRGALRSAVWHRCGHTGTARRGTVFRVQSADDFGAECCGPSVGEPGSDLLLDPTWRGDDAGTDCRTPVCSIDTAWPRRRLPSAARSTVLRPDMAIAMQRHSVVASVAAALRVPRQPVRPVRIFRCNIFYAQIKSGSIVTRLT